MKKPIYLRLNDFSHSVIEELLMRRVAKDKTAVIEQALDFYLKHNLTSVEYKQFIVRQHAGGWDD